jgi:hypothetical protein
MSQCGNLCADGLHFGRLLHTVDKHGTGTTVVQDVTYLRRGIGLIDRHGCRPESQRGEVGHMPLDSIVGQDCHPVTGGNAERPEAARSVVHLLAVLTPGQCLPDVIRAVPQCDSIGSLLDIAPKPTHDGLRYGQRAHGLANQTSQSCLSVVHRGCHDEMIRRALSVWQSLTSILGETKDHLGIIWPLIWQRRTLASRAIGSSSLY